jgi:hypothetical protein
MHRTWLSHKIIFVVKRERLATKFDFVKKHGKSTKRQNDKRPIAVQLCLMRQQEFYTFFMEVIKTKAH